MSPRAFELKIPSALINFLEITLITGLPLIIDQSLSHFLLGTLFGTITFFIVMSALYFGTSGNESSGVFIYGFVISLIVYVVYMIYLGFVFRSSGRTYIMSQGQR